MTSKARKGKKESAGSAKIEPIIDALAITGMPKRIALELNYLSTRHEWATICVTIYMKLAGS